MRPAATRSSSSSAGGSWSAAPTTSSSPCAPAMRPPTACRLPRTASGFAKERRVLSPADAELVARDRGLPGLATLLDPDAFLEAVRKAAPGTCLESARLRYVRYKHGTNCLVAYRLDGGGAPIDVYAKAHGLDAPEKLDKASERLGVVGALGRSRF